MQTFEFSSGVYQIRNILTNDIYIGSSVELKVRYQWHWARFRTRQHTNIILQRALDKYGVSNFVFEVLEYCSNTLEREQVYLDKLSPRYNILPTAIRCAMNTKLHNADITNVLNLLRLGKSCRYIASQYNVHYSTIYLIKNKNGIYGYRNHWATDIVTVNKIRTLLRTRCNITRSHMRQIADQLGISVSTVYKIYTNRTWKEAI